MSRSSSALRRPALRLTLAATLALLAAGIQGAGATAIASTGGVSPRAFGELDCNGLSPIQHVVKATLPCSDPRGYDAGRFFDNGHYVGHDEPSVRFLSNKPGSGNNVTWTEHLGVDPTAAPTVGTPGSDVTHFFELSIAPWFSMAICDPKSYPQTTCTPESDRNAPKGAPTYLLPGGGSALLELQFYPPGFAPFVDSISCDNSHWCSALTIDSLECTTNFGHCNPNCIEPVNFGFIQADGVPTGPPSPQLANLSTFSPNAKTLLMNSGDRIQAHIFDADIGGGGRALETRVTDLTTGQSGFMVASAANGFMNTNIGNCKGTPFNFQPEYNTAGPAELIPWTALQAGILTQFEIGHFTPCSAVRGKATTSFGAGTDTYWNRCLGPYESSTSADKHNGEPDAPCYKVGDTHGGRTDPNLVTGCVNSFFANGDLDFDGTSYWANWPDSTTPDTWPSTFTQLQPTTDGATYSKVQFETDAAASEATCQPDGSGCAVPPPGSPGNFYPYWSQATVGGQCVWEFGQMQNGNSFGGDAQYDGPSAFFFGTLSSKIMSNPTCS